MSEFELEILLENFITKVIIKHENEFYTMVCDNFTSNNLSKILGVKQNHIISMITIVTEKYFNNLNNNNPIILAICSYAKCDSDFVINKLKKIVLEIHLDIDRKNLFFYHEHDAYEKSVLTELILALSKANLIQLFNN